jgi:hypothetical protein
MTERSDVRERFMAAIAQQIPADRVVEMHFFQPLKQGGTESGVAVVAVAEPKPGSTQPADVPDAHSASAEDFPESRSDAAENSSSDRLAVYTARYRLTQKGPERGKWEFALNAEADAPLVTVDKVVQGVQRRSGDSEDPQRLTGEEFRAALPASAPSSLPAPPSG